MAKTKISSADLAWIFAEKSKPLGDCAPTIAVAIIQGWLEGPSGPEGPSFAPSLRRAYRAGSDRASQDLRSD
jgi:hypothetical protein